MRFALRWVFRRRAITKLSSRRPSATSSRPVRDVSKRESVGWEANALASFGERPHTSFRSGSPPIRALSFWSAYPSAIEKTRWRRSSCLPCSTRHERRESLSP